MPTRNEIIEVYGPQLGELAWHSLHVDTRLATMSEQHAASILRVVEHCRLKPAGRPIRILEVGAYAHYGAHRAAAALGGESVAHDVSPASLRVGLDGAHAAGLLPETTLVAGDFHDLPFSTGYFDVVFCASSIHHTFRPWRVLHEMMRVLRPGGALQLENEPIGRALCFYGFRSNREAAYSPFEAELARRGSLYTFSSPFPGSRPEILFGMIENERIPLDMVLDTLVAEGEIESLQLLPLLGEFERRILALPRDADLEASLATLLLTEIEAVQPALTERDRLLGVRLPERDDVWRLSYQAAPRLRRLTGLAGPEAERETVRLFGAALQATVVKHGVASPAAQMFRRQLSLQDWVYNDLPSLPGVCLHLDAQPIPAIETEDLAALAGVYPPDNWEPHREDNGLFSMLNLGARCRITLPALPSEAMLLLRFYAVAADQPYRASLQASDKAEIVSLLVAQSESHLLRELVPPGCSELFIETRTLDGEPVSLPRHIRLGVGRLIPVGP
jgi:SAM-dependent methyltransferase